jgi:hypothetical protein
MLLLKFLFCAMLLFPLYQSETFYDTASSGEFPSAHFGHAMRFHSHAALPIGLFSSISIDPAFSPPFTRFVLTTPSFP